MLHKLFQNMRPDDLKEHWEHHNSSKLVQEMREKYPGLLIGNRFAGLEIELENVQLNLEARAARVRPADAFDEDPAQAVNRARNENYDLQLAWLHSGIPSFWVPTQDGSLRNNGREFVSRFGLTFSEITKGVNLLAAELPKQVVAGTVPEANGRTGLHVHVDMSEATVDQVCRYIALYLVFEDTFFFISGNRKAGPYCVPLRNSEEDVSELILISKEPTFKKQQTLLYRYLERCHKYSALNILSLLNHTTLEWRQHAGSFDPVAINKWLSVIAEFSDYALNGQSFENLMNELNQLKTQGLYEDFIRKVFPRNRHTLWWSNIYKDMYAGIVCVQELLVEKHRIPDEFSAVKVKKNKTVKKAGVIDNRDIGQARQLADEVDRQRDIRARLAGRALEGFQIDPIQERVIPQPIQRNPEPRIIPQPQIFFIDDNGGPR